MFGSCEGSGRWASCFRTAWGLPTGQSRTPSVSNTRSGGGGSRVRSACRDIRSATRSSTLTAPDDDLLYPREVAEIFGVRTTTIGRWAREGKLTPMRAPGGHRRYSRAGIRDVPERETASEDTERVIAEDAARLYAQAWSIRQVMGAATAPCVASSDACPYETVAVPTPAKGRGSRGQ